MAITKEVNIIVKEQGMESVNKKVSELNTGVKTVTKSTKDFQKTANEQSGGGMFAQIKSGAQQLIPALKGAESGLMGVGAKMWELVKNPVGLIIAGIVVSLKFLYEAFQSSVAGGKELKTIFAGVSAVGVQVKDAIFGLGRALINVTTAAYKFITLDFKGAAEDMQKANNEAAESYDQLTNAVDGTTFAIVRNLEKRQQANDKAKKIQAVVQSETNKLLVQSRETLTDETASIKEKEKALQAVTKAEKESSKEKVRVAKEDLDILKAKAKALGGEAEKKMKGEIRDATIALNEAETENAMTGIKLNKQRKMLHREEMSRQKEILDAQKAKKDAEAAAEKIRIDKIKEDRKKELDAFKESDKFIEEYLEDKAVKELIAADKKKKEQDSELERSQKARQNGLDAIKLAKEKEIALENQVKDAKYDIANQTLGLISEIAGKGSKVAKAAAIAQATISGVQGVQNAFTTASLNPITTVFPAYPFVQAGLAGAFSALQIAKIAKGDKASSSGGGNQTTTTTTQAPSFNLVQGTATNQIASSINKQQPIEAYVVSKNVSSGQELDRNIIKSASL